ncbi:MAG: hypothetical protein CSA03_00645 [Bacteroidetes bacterium]|nr:MAG: hypothetical protein CSA03_00645 [Bacteroidota bacterium]
MKKFLLRVVIFSTLTLIISFGLIALLNSLVQKDGFYHVNEDISSIVVGDSHPECAFNDSLIDSMKNFAQSGESYFYTYVKLKRILEHNSHIDRVFVEFNNGQMIKNMDSSIWDDKHVSSKFPKYGFAMEYEELYLLGSHNLSALINAQSISVLWNVDLLQKEKRTMYMLDWGGYKRLTNDGEGLIDSAASILKSDSMVVEHSTVNLEYLLKLVKLCKEKKVEVVFVRSPVHQKYYGRKNEVTFRYIQKKYFSEIPFLDYQDKKLEDKDFADLHHLNYMGAKKFSIYFNNELKQSQLK